MEPIVLIHGYSSEGKTTDQSIRPENYAALYGDLPQRLRTELGATVVEIDISRWVSLDDGVSIDDISEAMNRALKNHDGGKLLEDGFNVIIHSTGALVTRNWIRRFWESGQCKARRVIYLAGANWGSGWAHMGQALFAKWFRESQGTQRGTKVLDALELASDWTINMHLEVQNRIRAAAKADRPMEFCICGTQHELPYVVCPIRYAREDGSDGVVRVTGCNLNFNYLKLALKDSDAKATAVKRHDYRASASKGADVYGFSDQLSHLHREQEGLIIPFAVPYDTAHNGGATGIVSGTNNAAQMMRLIVAALQTQPDTLAATAALYDQETAATYAQVAALRPRSQTWKLVWKRDVPANYEAHSQVIFRLRDQYGNPVPDCTIYFNTLGGERAKEPFNYLIEDHHKNGKSRANHLFFMRVEKWKSDYSGRENRIASLGGITLDVDADEPASERVAFVDVKIDLSTAHLMEYIRPHETTIIDIELARIPDSKVFVLNKA